MNAHVDLVDTLMRDNEDYEEFPGWTFIDFSSHLADVPPAPEAHL